MEKNHDPHGTGSYGVLESRGYPGGRRGNQVNEYPGSTETVPHGVHESRGYPAHRVEGYPARELLPGSEGFWVSFILVGSVFLLGVVFIGLLCCLIGCDKQNRRRRNQRRDDEEEERDALWQGASAYSGDDAPRTAIENPATRWDDDDAVRMHGYATMNVEWERNRDTSRWDPSPASSWCEETVGEEDRRGRKGVPLAYW